MSRWVLLLILAATAPAPSRAESVEIPSGIRVLIELDERVSSKRTAASQPVRAFKALSKHFNRGINRFEVRSGEQTAEVVLEIEL